MKTNQLQLVNFEQAKRLKVAGFDFPVNSFYYGDLTYIPIAENHNNNKGDKYSAPTVALALKWLRDEKGMCNVQVSYSHVDTYIFFIGDKIKGHWDTYEAAESALLDELLKMIEENNQ
jgi:hypothetical protein